jgi:hypothetical protein
MSCVLGRLRSGALRSVPTSKCLGPRLSGFRNRTQVIDLLYSFALFPAFQPGPIINLRPAAVSAEDGPRQISRAVDDAAAGRSLAESRKRRSPKDPRAVSQNFLCNFYEYDVSAFQRYSKTNTDKWPTEPQSWIGVCGQHRSYLDHESIDEACGFVHSQRKKYCQG